MRWYRHCPECRRRMRRVGNEGVVPLSSPPLAERYLYECSCGCKWTYHPASNFLERGHRRCGTKGKTEEVEDVTRRDDDDNDEYEFTVSGVMDVTRDAEPKLDLDGSICGFYLPDGRLVRLVVALEVMAEGGIEYITDQGKMEALGCRLVDYFEVRFDG